MHKNRVFCSAWGFSFIELVVVVMILSFVLGISFTHFRNARSSVGTVAIQLGSHMEMRRAIDRLTEALLDGTEVVSPFPGSTKRSLVVKDIANQMKILFLEKKPVSDPKFPVREIYTLHSYTDTYTGTFEPKQQKKLFENIKDLTFTTVAPGLVIAHLTVIDPSGKELASIVELPLKNVGSIDD